MVDGFSCVICLVPNIILIMEIDIEKIKTNCEKYRITNYRINDDGSINVFQNVRMGYYSLIKIPLKFNFIDGDFSLSGNNLVSLEGCPKVLTGSLSLLHNKNLKNLEHSPEEVGRKIFLRFSGIESLKGLKVPYSKLNGLGDNKMKLIRKHKLSNFIEN